MDSLICEFCNKNFSNRSNLNNHLKTAKYCIERRDASSSDKKIEVNINHKCDFCEKVYTTKYMLIAHISKCKEKKKNLDESLKNELLQKNEEIKMLKEENKLISLKDQEIIFLKKQLTEKNSEIESYKNQINSIILKTIGHPEKQNVNEEKNTLHSSLIPECVPPLNEQSDNSLVLKDSYQLVYRPEDGYIDVTNLCSAGHKKFNDWKRLNKTSAFLEILSASTGCPANQLLKYQSGSNSERRTWAHPQVAINIAQWISPEFDVQVSRWVYEIMLTGKTDIGNPKTTQQLDQLAKENQQYAEKIQYFERKFIQRGRRTEYQEQNVVYIVTTNSREVKKEYKIGKTHNLTNRLSTYNTTEDHKVVFIQECETPEDMNKLEKFVLAEMSDLRIQANREWFCGEVEEMIRYIKECKMFMDRGKK